ncbi:MAG TPA: cytochrome d ubiquinol oxidase subunit II [Acidobacteriota bacterium]|jgi:cytochrome d ubiquinol oxidase subunit II|nr:cytochrome d ubiquinol oxidase subunit II [Acidobacteriota bacterium]HNT16597.1 cytochrome d ubiquinol oxidase subunit II [Acidobacteriota bacterium]HPA26700.1 cytochrome d ubiquinol oxidase subunit II [Acidobacteriota bacterium]HQO19942.1 cytochrome d ubiquinol oxidase subunit II [Acidobacteriota bacterium]HQQ46781.1 cytochrome d ubiquinol oxidase subunit II [Acidobacteriota bacterium]
MEYQVTWFVLWGVLWAVYFMLDGFDLGVGMLMNFIARSDGEKRLVINTIGPFWDGNEVWLITAGGATFAAFPTTYAYMFSYLYPALLIILFALIFRGVAFEFRGKGEGDKWKRSWDIAIFAGSSLPALLFGVAFGNIFRGLPIDASGYHGTLFSLLNPFGLLSGVFFVMMFLQHGALWLSIKTDGEVRARAEKASSGLLYPVIFTAVIFLTATAFPSKFYDNFAKAPLLVAVPMLAVLGFAAAKFMTARGKWKGAFFASCASIIAVMATGMISLYPNLIPSSIDPAHSLTIFNSSSSPYTLKIMTIVALLFVPVVIAYQFWVYRVLKGRLTVEGVVRDKHSY